MVPVMASIGAKLAHLGAFQIVPCVLPDRDNLNNFETSTAD